MGNVLNLYDPIFYAQEGLIALHKALGLAGRVHRGYDKSPQSKGSTISINRPATFTATDVNTSTGGTTQDVKPGNVDISLNNWKEVKFALTDKELTFTGQKIIEDHIQPAAYALADVIDQSVAALYVDIPWVTSLSSTVVPADITAARKIMFDNKVNLKDPRFLHMMWDGKAEADLLASSAFTQNQGSGQAGIDSQISGILGPRYGFNHFANQNCPSHTSGGDADVVGVAAEALIGAKTINISSVGDSAAFKAGDTFKIAGHTQKYVLTADATATTGSITGATFEPGLEKATAGSEVLTFEVGSASTTKNQCLAFHRNAFALAMAPLSDMGNMLGARIETVVDETTGLAIRARMWYEGNTSTVKVALDALWGVKTLDRNMALRMRQP